MTVDAGWVTVSGFPNGLQDRIEGFNFRGCPGTEVDGSMVTLLKTNSKRT